MMKNIYKKSLVAGAILAFTSAHCFADQVNAQVIAPPPPPQAQVLPVAPVTTVATKPANEVVSGAAALTELKRQEEAPATLYSKLNPAQTAELKISEVNAKKLDELTRQRDQAEAELAIIKIEADKAKVESDIRKIKGEKLPSEIQAAEDEQLQQGSSKTPSSKLSPLDKVFVTQIYGMSGDEQVTVFYENSILKVKRGDEVTDGVRLARVVSNGADFTYKGKTKRVTLTTQKQAFSRTFTEPKSESTTNNFMPSGLMPVMQPPVGYRATPMN